MDKKELLENAKSLRRNMTPEEKHLWYDFLRHHSIKIYRQRIIDGFIVDFCCHSAKLVIEIDGSQHYTPEGKSYDNSRSGVLRERGLHILRFTNGDVNNNFDGVCYMINKAIEERVESPLTH